MVYHGQELKVEIKKALDKWVKPVLSTMGGAGKMVISYGKEGMRISPDGITVSRHMLAPETGVEKAIVVALTDAARQVVDIVGDGTSQTMCLVHAIYSAYYATPSKNLNMYSFLKGIDDAVEAVCRQIQIDTVPVLRSEVQVLNKIANISTHGRSDFAAQIAELASKVGGDGIVMVDQSHSPETTTEHINGYVFDGGLASSQLINVPGQHASILHDPYFVIINEELNQVDHVVQIIRTFRETVIAPNNKMSPLVFICERAVAGALSTILANHISNPSNEYPRYEFAIVTAPEVGLERHEILSDIQAMTGTPKVYRGLSGVHLQDFGEDDTIMEFGHADRIVCYKDRSVIYFDKEAQSRVNVRIEDVRSLMDSDPERKEWLKKRLARLQAGIGVIRVGGGSMTEHTILADLADDASKACLSVLREGYVTGGGMAIRKAAERAAARADRVDDSYVKGFDAVCSACVAPSEMIVTNSGAKVNLSKIDRGDVYDVVARKIGKAINLGVIDPSAGPQTALRKAASVAKNLINTSYMIIKEDG
jgi:chaperonin GroEL